MATKETTTKPAAKKVAAKAPAKKVAHKAPAKKVAHKAPEKAETVEYKEEVVKPAATIVLTEKPKVPAGRYIFATGRRKTAVANIRLFSGTGEIVVNKKKFDVYFDHSSMRDEAVRPLALTGLLGDFYFTATVNGGGIKAQSEAVRHGIAQALASMNEDLRNVLKKNGFLTRDDRKKERKKPGLRRARRAPQWAKR